MIHRGDWGQIVLLGDVFDLWAAPFHKIARMHAAVLAVLEAAECTVTYVPGNHDDAFRGLSYLNSFQTVWPYYRFSSGGKWVVAAHGDTYDEFEGVPSRFGAWASRLADRVARWFAGPGVSITRSFRYSYAERGPGRSSYVAPIHSKAAADLDGDIVLIGHTHVPTTREEHGEKILVNTGDFGPEHMTYVVVEDGRAELRSIDPS